MLAFAVEDTRSGTNDLVTGNVIFNPGDELPRSAPDVMVIPGLKGREFRSYQPVGSEPVPSVAVEIRSKSNTVAEIDSRARRMLTLGVSEYYVLDPERQTVHQVALNTDNQLTSVMLEAPIARPSG